MNLMHYDVGLLAREEDALLSSSGVTPPSWQQTASSAPFSIVTTVTGEKIGFMRFPSLLRHEIPPKELIERLSLDIARYRREVRLLIGLSEWGWLAEQEYLAANPKAVPDFLFGSGKGSGVNGRIKADGRCVWIRAYDKGRSIAEISILEWPDRNNPFAWEPEKNYKTASIGLNDTIKDHPAVNAVLQ